MKGHTSVGKISIFVGNHSQVICYKEFDAHLLGICVVLVSNLYFLKHWEWPIPQPWRTLVAGDEQPYRPRVHQLKK